MMKTNLVLASMLSGLLLSTAVQAGEPPYPMANSRMADRMAYPDRSPPPLKPRKRRLSNDFPTQQELARLVPPEPVTEASIKERFAKRKAKMTEMLDRDRQAAEKYAQDFARYQKEQANRLVELMSRAEKRREGILKRLDQQEQRALQYFRERTGAQAPVKTESQSAQ